MKFYVVVNYYLVSLNFKFHEEPGIYAPTQDVNMRTHILSECARLWLMRAHLCKDLHEI